MSIAFLLIFFIGLFLMGCRSTKTSTAIEGNQRDTTVNTRTDLSSLFKATNIDTLSALKAIAGEWHLSKICKSTYVGLSCDTTKTMLIKVDDAGNIIWEKDGQTQRSGKLQFVKHGGAGTGVAKGDSVWVLGIAQNDGHSYLVQKLQNDSLQLAEYPLIMDKTTTYYLHK